MPPSMASWRSRRVSSRRTFSSIVSDPKVDEVEVGTDEADQPDGGQRADGRKPCPKHQREGIPGSIEHERVEGGGITTQFPGNHLEPEIVWRNRRFSVVVLLKMSDSDTALLAAYREEGDETAFTELVRRHLGLVFTSALRQVRVPQIAEEIAQSTFLKLARQGTKLAPNTVLTAWLYQVARNEAIDAIRAEARRKKRDEVAMEESAMNQNASTWEMVEPLLDEAMQSLNEQQRTVVLLRFFENKSLREVGLATGTTEDAAQKRVTRATEALKNFFENRGFNVSCDGLTAVICANAVQTAPVALSRLVLSGTYSVATLQSLTGVLHTKLIIMTTLQKAFVAASFAIVLGTAIYEEHRASRLQNRLVEMEHQQVPTAKRIAQLESDLALALHRPAGSSAQSMAAQNSGEVSIDRINQLLNATNWPSLTAEQADRYLTQRGRNAASLLAVFRANGDGRLLEEALRNHPGDPQVNFAALFGDALSPEQKRQRLDSFEKAAPNNALANYLSALDYLKTGQTTAAVRELNSGIGKTEFRDYSMSFRQNAEEAYRSAGYSEAEAKVIASHSLLMPHLVDLNQFGQDMVALAANYRQAGDEPSAQNVLQLGVSVGQRIEGSSEDPSLTTELLGAGIERQSLKAMDPNSIVGNGGQTASQRLADLKQLRTDAQDLARQFDAVQKSMTPGDWIAYFDRVRSFGESSAMQWFVGRSHSP